MLLKLIFIVYFYCNVATTLNMWLALYFSWTVLLEVIILIENLFVFSFPLLPGQQGGS